MPIVSPRTTIRVGVFSRTRGSKTTWYLRWQDPKKRNRSERACDATTEEEARVLAKDLERQLLAALHAPAERVAWTAFIRLYSDDVLQYKALKTAERHLATLKEFSNCGRILKMDSVTQEIVDAFVSRTRAQAVEQGWSHHVLVKRCAIIKEALAWAKSRKMIDFEPRFNVARRDKSRVRMRGRPISEAEFRSMLSQIPAAPKIRGMNDVTVADWEREMWGAWFSSLRLSELPRVSWDADAPFRVDMTGQYPVYVITAHAHKSGRDTITPIAPEFVEWLLQVPPENRRGPVFPIFVRAGDALGRWISYLGESAKIVVNNRADGTVKYASTHDFRRSFAERWAMRVMPHVLQMMMRHEDIRMTMRYYVGRDAQNAAEAMWLAMPGQQIGTCAPSVSDQT